LNQSTKNHGEVSVKGQEQAQKKKVQKAGPIITKGRKRKLRRNAFNAIMRGHFAAEF
jgi:hypothetical protein